jgi:hypothetical protein
MVTATVFFLLAAIFGHGGYVDHAVGSGSLVLTLIGFGLLALGGWLGAHARIGDPVPPPSGGGERRSVCP